MFSRIHYLVTAATTALMLLGGVSTSIAQTTSPILRSWMSPDVGDAWTQGYKGQKTTITIVDDFSSGNKFTGNLGTGSLLYRHGEWTRLEVSMIAPLATIRSQSFYSGTTVPLAAGLNVLNLSYGMYAKGTYSLSQLAWKAQESSIISYARNGRAVVVKAAGNDGIAIGSSNAAGNKDFLNLALVGTQSAIFVGALTGNGTVANPVGLASYSNKAGTNTAVQSHFLVVGVDSSKTGLAGTSFAAPIISGYASILGSKFTSATPTQITNQLLTTARKDTLLNYNAATYGMGEASLSRALAPLTIR